MAIQATSVPSKRLAASILSTDSSFQVNNILSWKGLQDGTTTLTSADFPTRAFGVFRNSTNTQIEFFEFDPTTIASTSITIIGRGLAYTGAYVDGAVTKYNWNQNETIVELGSHGPQEFQIFRDYVDTAITSGAVPATTTVSGLVELATQPEYDAGTATGGTGASLAATPAITRGKKYNDYVADSVGTDAYAITPVPAITAYVAGQEFTFKAGTANTGGATLNVSGLGAKTIVKNVGTALATGDILINQIVKVVYDASGNFQIVSNILPAILPVAQGGTGIATVRYTTGVISRDLTAAGAAVTTAHGLGTTPVRIKITALNGSTVLGDVITCNSQGTYDGTNIKSITLITSATAGPVFENSTSYIVKCGSTSTINQTAVPTFDATNITLTWTKNNSPTSTAELLWEAWAF